MKTHYGIAALALLGTVLTQSSQATTYTWNFDKPKGAVAASHDYLDISNTYTLSAYGYSTAKAPVSSTLGSTWITGTTTPTKLYDKVTNGDLSETGLGLAGKSENEIDSKSFVQLDVSALKNAHLINLTMFVSSIQKNEGFFLWGSNTLGTPGALLKSFVNTSNNSSAETQSFLVPHYNDYRYFALSADGGNVLLRDGLSAQSSVPEPGVYAMLTGMALPAAGLLLRRRRRAR